MKRSTNWSWLLVAASLGACGPQSIQMEPVESPVAKAEPTAPPAPPPAAIPPAPPEAPKLRLPDTVRPTRFAVELTVDPTAEPFSGVIDIDVELREPQKVLWLNAEDLDVSLATASVGAAGGETLTASVVPTKTGFVGLVFPRDVPAGAARLHLEYAGKLAAKEVSGPTRQKEEGTWYVFTHFEPIDARRAYPCFDEPSYKVPWRFAFKVKSADTAFANTPETKSRDLGDGWKRVEFAESKPLPSYLTAWAVGPFEIVDGGKSTRSGTAVRIIVPKGKKEWARWAASSSAPVLAVLEEYFGTNYPFEKLDVISVPLFNGAMENPGLVTFNQQLILQKPGEETIGRKRGYATVAAHEFAHMWFGDLVTMAWWDDLWLNEAFATWSASKTIETWQPKWGLVESRVQAKNGAMSADSLVTARRIRQPIESEHDMSNAFDAITYQKGAAVITMFERSIGEDVFRRGVQQYMRDFAGKNATARDFLAAISTAAGKDIAPAFSTFLDQPGVPLVSVTLDCPKKGAAGSAALQLAQERYLPEGSPGDKENKQSWQIPVCARWGQGTKTGRACTTLSEATGRLALDGVTGCPDWVWPNEASSGYYRVRMAGGDLARLAQGGARQLTVAERLGVMNDLGALVRAGRVPVGEALALVPTLAKDDSRFVVQSAAAVVGPLRDSDLLSASLRPSYAKFIRDNFGARARKLGWKSKPGDDEDTKLLRETVVPLVADQGEDAQLGAEAKQLAAAWLKDHAAVDPDMVGGVLEVAAHRGDRALFDAWHEAAKKTTDRAERRKLLSAMGQFRDPEIAKAALAITLTDEFDVREAMGMLRETIKLADTRAAAWQFVQANFDAIAARLPRDAAMFLVYSGVAQCDEKQLPAVEAFFKDRAPNYRGGPRTLAQALEQMRLCIAYRKSQTPSIEKFFSQKSK